MGKKVKDWMPPSDAVVAEEPTPASESQSWMPPEDAIVEEPLKKKDESELASPDGKGFVAPGAPSEPNGSEPTLSESQKKLKKLYEFEFKDWQTNRQKEVQSLIDQDPSQFEKLNKQFEKEQRDKLTHYEKDFVKWAGMSAKREAEKDYEKNKETDLLKTTGKSLWSTFSNQIPSTLIGMSAYLGAGDQTNGVLGYDTRAMQQYLGEIREGKKPDYNKIIENKRLTRKKELVKIAMEYSAKDAEARKYLVDNLDKVEDPIDALNWIGNAIGQAAGQIPLAVVTGGSSSISQEIGSIYLDGVRKIAQEKGVSPDEIIAKGEDESIAPLLYGTVAGVLDKIGADKVLDTFTKKELINSLRQRALNVLASGGMEAATEGAQTLLEQLGVSQQAGKTWAESFKNIDLDEIKEAAAQGLVGGTALSGIGSITSSARQSMPRLAVQPMTLEQKVQEAVKPADRANPATIDQAAAQAEAIINAEPTIQENAGEIRKDQGETTQGGEVIEGSENVRSENLQLPEETQAEPSDQEGGIKSADQQKQETLTPEATAGEQPTPPTDGEVNQEGQGQQEGLLTSEEPVAQEGTGPQVSQYSELEGKLSEVNDAIQSLRNENPDQFKKDGLPKAKSKVIPAFKNLIEQRNSILAQAKPLMEEEFTRRGRQASEQSRVESEKLSQEFNTRQEELQKNMSPEDIQEEQMFDEVNRIFDKVNNDESPTKEEIDYINQNAFLPKGYVFTEKGLKKGKRPEYEQSSPKPTEPIDTDVEEGIQQSAAIPDGSGTPIPPGDEGGIGTILPEQGGTTQPSAASEQRKFGQQLLNDPNLSEEVKRGLSEDAINYIPKGVQISNAEAQAIIQAKGDDLAIKDFLDMTNGMLPDVRVLLGENLIRKFNADENYADAIKVADNLAMQLTDLGRGINAAKVFSMLTPEGVIRYVQKELQKSKAKYTEETGGKRKRSKKSVDEINAKTIDEILSPKSETGKKVMSAVKKGNVKKAIDFLEKLKIEQPKGMASAQIVPLGLPIAAWNATIGLIQDALKAGLTISQAVNKALKKLKEKGVDVDEGKFRAYLDDQLKDFRVTLDPEKALKEEIKDQGTTIDKIIQAHYTDQQAAKKSLVDKLVKDANVPAEQATEITAQLEKAMDELTRTAKEKALRKYLPKAKRNQDQARKTVIDNLIDASNVGALDEEVYREEIGKKLGPASMTEDQAKQVKELADKVQKAKSDFDRNKAQENLMRYIDKNIKGIRFTDVAMAIWYANILSGFSTQAQNLYGNLTNTLSEAYTAAMMNPKEAGFIFKGLFQGYGRGMLEAMDTFKTGYQPIKGDVKQIATSSPVLEQIEFKGGKWNPYNYLKYVQRLMGATDIFFYHGLKEMRSRELAVARAKEAGKINTDRSIIIDAKNFLYGEENAWQAALDEASQEGYQGQEQTRRAYELIEKARPEFIQHDSNEAALRGTYNQQPKGVLGMLSGLINFASDKIDIAGVKPLKFVIPFTRIIANVANTALDYSPWAFARAAKGGIGYENFGNYYQRYTQEEKSKLLIKGITGTLGMAALAALTDDEEGVFQITADGTGDVQKNYELQNTGWQPYSIKIGDTWFEYRNTPLAIPFAMIGFWRDGIKYRGQQEDYARLSILMYGTMKYIMDLSFLQSLSSFFDTFSKENPNEGKNFFTKATKETEKVTKAVLVPNLFTQVSRSMQEVMDMPIKRAENLGDQITRDMPLLRDRLENMYNSLGDPVIPNQISKALPFKIKSEPTGKDKELYDLIADNNAWISKPGRGSLKINNGQSMTDDEYEKFSFQAGKLTKKYLLDRLPELKRMKNKEEVKDAILSIKRQARRETNISLFGEKSYF